MRLRKALCCIFTMLLVSSLFAGYVIAGDKEVGTLKAGNVDAKAGETVSIPVTIEANPGITSMKLVVTFDDDLEIVRIVDKDILGDYVHPSEFTGNSFNLYWNNPTTKENYTVTGDIAELVFKVKDTATIGQKDITITYGKFFILDVGANAVEFTITNGSITVLGKDFETTPTLTGTGEVTYDGQAHTISVANQPVDSDVTWYLKGTDGEYTQKIDNPSFKSAGTYEVKAVVSKAGYNDVTLEGKLTINKAEVTVTANDVTRPYNGTTTANTAGATAYGIVGDDKVSFQLASSVNFDSADVGTYCPNATITWTGTDEAKANYNLPTTAQVKVEITQKQITVTADSFSKTKGLDLPELTYTVDPEGGLVGTDQLVVSLTAQNWSKDTEIVDDEYVITGTLGINPEASAKNYDLQLVDGKMSIIDDTLESIKVTAGENFKNTYFVGEPLDVENLTITAHYEKNGDVIVPANQCTITPSEMPDVVADGTKQTITVTYNGKIDSTIEVTVNIDDIVSISANTTDEWIWVGEEPTVTVTATYESGNTDTLAADDYAVTVANTAEAAEAQVTVTCGTITNTDLKITVIEKALDRLEVVETAEGALSKVAGQTFKVSDDGVQINAVYKDKSGVESKVDVTSEFNTVEITSATAGKVSKPITYTKKVGGYEKEVTCNLTVDFAAKAVSSITATAPTKTEYTEGTKFDPAGMTVTITYNDGDIVSVTDNYANYNITFTPATLTLGDTTVTVSCGSKTAQVDVTVIPKVLDSISVKPIKDTYVDGESFSKDDIEVTAEYNNGTTATVTDYIVNEETFTLTDAAVAGTVTVKVTYTGKDATYVVTVKPCVAIVNGKRYADLNEAIENAKAGDTIEMPLPGEYDVDVDKDLTFKNTSDEDISMKINNEEVTIEADSSYEVEIKDEMDSTYFTFYLQMLQWRNRTFIVSYKQTEGGTVSGANAARFSQSVTFTVTPDDGYAIADVLVNGKSVGAVDSYTIRSIKANTTVSATFEKLETEAVEIVPETTPWANPFTDVGEMDAFYVAVQYVYENGLFKGMSDTEFGPAITMNRAMFVTVLGRLTGVNVDDFTTVTFADCEAGSWYAPYVEWAAKSGIVNGMSATEFAPDAEITVEQALTILYRYMIAMGYDLTGAADLTAYADAASVSDWAAPAVQWAVANGIYEAADALAPQSAAARSLVATLLYNLSGMLAK